MDAGAFRKHGHELVDWIAGYLEHAEKYPVLARIEPGDITAAWNLLQECSTGLENSRRLGTTP